MKLGFRSGFVARNVTIAFGAILLLGSLGLNVYHGLRQSQPKPEPGIARSSDIELNLTYRSQDESFAFDGRVTNTSKHPAPKVTLVASCREFAGYGYTRGTYQPNATGSFVGVAEILSNMEPGESRTVTIIVPRFIDPATIEGLTGEPDTSRRRAVKDGKWIRLAECVNPHIVAMVEGE